MTDRKQELIDRYIRGEMTADERLAFEKQLTEDEELYEMHKYTAKVSKAVKDRNEKLEKIKQWEQEHKDNIVQRKSYSVVNKIAFTFMTVAAVTALVMFINKGPSMPEMDTQKYLFYRGSSTVTHVANLIEEEKYDNALYVIEHTEKEFQEDLDSLEMLKTSLSNEDKKRVEYEVSATSLDKSEMQWLKVYALM